VPIVGSLDGLPSPAGAALIVIEGDEEGSSFPYESRRTVKGLPHSACVMEHAPGIDDIKWADSTDVIGVEYGCFFDMPARIRVEIATLQLLCAGYRFGIEIE
jgi:hypothetical protein